MNIKSIVLNLAVLLLLAINILNIVQKGFSILNLMAILLCCIVFAIGVVDWRRGKSKDE